MKPKLKEIQLGHAYGESEVKYLKNFKDFYYDINEAKSRILSDEKFVIVGRKGTGKTLLSNVVCESLKDTYVISSHESLKEFVFHQLKHIEGYDLSPTKYVPIFEWMVYINLAKHIIDREDKFCPKRIDILLNFLRYFGHKSGELKIEKTIEMTKKFQDGLEGSLKFFDFGAKLKSTVDESIKEGTRTYLECLESLKEFITQTLMENESKVIVFYDELDDKFKNNAEYKEGIVSFLSAVEKINHHFHKLELKVKICAVIRSDIVDKLNSPNINRIFEDNSIFLSWDAECANETDLFEMLAHKTRCSSNFYANKNTENILEDIFPSHISGEYFKHYIIDRTLGRPRDLVRMLKFVQDCYGENMQKFESYTFEKTLRDYSKYLKREVKMELIGHVEDDILTKYFDFLSTLGKWTFNFAFVVKKNEVRKSFESDDELRKMLTDLFNAGAICNVVRRSKSEGGNYYFKSYLDESLEINFDHVFEIHPGLWHTLQIPIPKNRFY
ncbi:P-loop ATPase, Sll1717 family [Shewanella frigidimarina]|uniref:P-loop ATPase, Sll1717 family n=1 Tax=Shewanella frigidimarina TaxID=56812 RepID=UPI003FA0F310